MIRSEVKNMKKKVIKNKDLSKKIGLEEKVKKGTSTSKVELLSQDGGVLGKKVLDAKSKAGKIIEEARAEAEKIRKEAEALLSQVESEQKREKERGYLEGREEGLSSVTEQVTKFEKMKEEFYRDAEENTIKLVMMLAEKVIGKMVHEHAEAIKSIIKQALESALGDRILVRVSPDDYKDVMAAESEFKELLDRTQRLIIKEDETIEQGGCLVETEVGTIDARLETQLKAIRKALEL